MTRSLCVVVALVLGSAFSVGAQDAEAPPSNGETPENAEAAQQARAHFQEGMTHFQARNFREAIHAFQLAASLVPSADLWFNIARAYEELNDEPSLQQAIEHYRRYLRDRVDPPDRAQVESRITALEARAESARQARLARPTTGTLRVASNIEGATVEVGGDSVGESPIAAPLTLSEGSHSVELAREGYIPFRGEVQVAAGVASAAYADLEPETRFRAVRGRRIFTWIVGGLAVAGIAASIGLGVKARGFVDGTDPTDEQYDDARRFGAISDYVLGSSIALAVGALILYFVEGRAIGTERVGVDETADSDLESPVAF